MYDNVWCNLLPPPCLPGWMLEAARWTLLPESVWFQYGHGWMLNTLAETSMCTVWYPFQHLQHKMVVINIHDFPNIIHQHHTSTIILWNIIHYALVVDTSYISHYFSLSLYYFYYNSSSILFVIVLPLALPLIIINNYVDIDKHQR
jgi:hypothetical protein